MASSAPLAEQLRPVAARLSSQQPTIRAVSQSELAIRGKWEEEGKQVKHLVLSWMAERAKAALPEEAWLGRSFQVDPVHTPGAQFCAAFAVDEPDYWAARLDDQDKSNPDRTWLTEVSIGPNPNRADRILFGLRLSHATRGEQWPVTGATPTLLRRVAHVVPVHLDGHQLHVDEDRGRYTARPWVVGDDDDVAELVDLLLDPERRHDVVVLSLPEGANDPSFASLPVGPFANRVFGAAHVVVISGSASYALTRSLGKPLSVFWGAVRIYRPGFNPDIDNRFHHPLILANEITENVGRYEAWIATSLLRTTTARPTGQAIPSFADVRRVASIRAREADNQTDGDTAALLEQAKDRLRNMEVEQGELSATWNGVEEILKSEKAALLEENNGLRQKLHAAQARIAYLEQRSKAPSGDAAALPNTLAELADWADLHLVGNVAIVPRALRSAASSPFEKVDLVYLALLALRDLYVPMRRGHGGIRREQYIQRLAELGLDDTPCFSGSGAGKFGDTYRIRYDGRVLDLDRHLKGSNDRDPRYGFRLYFCWDEVDGQVVVGMLPNHLQTDAS